MLKFDECYCGPWVTSYTGRACAFLLWGWLRHQHPSTTINSLLNYSYIYTTFQFYFQCRVNFYIGIISYYFFDNARPQFADPDPVKEEVKKCTTNAWRWEGGCCVLACEWWYHYLHMSTQTYITVHKTVIAFCRWYGWSFTWPTDVQFVSQGTRCATATGSFMSWCKRSKYLFFQNCGPNLILKTVTVVISLLQPQT